MLVIPRVLKVALEEQGTKVNFFKLYHSSFSEILYSNAKEITKVIF